MNSLNAHRGNQGFTLIESLIIVLVIGILAAIAAPSFLATLNRSRVNDALASVEGALKEAQREAIKRSTNCTVTLDTTDKKVTGPCLVTGDRDLCEKRDDDGNCIQPKALIDVPPDGNEITYTFKGHTASAVTIKIYRPDTSSQKCLVVSAGIGIMRTGDLEGTNCKTSS
jgi:prepilin-type N-terminal cleavage/methylation domain-containing protein